MIKKWLIFCVLCKIIAIPVTAFWNGSTTSEDHEQQQVFKIYQLTHLMLFSSAYVMSPDGLLTTFLKAFSNILFQ